MQPLLNADKVRVPTTAQAAPRTNKLLNARQAAFLYLAVVTIYKLVNLPTVLVQRAGRDGWLVVVILMAWELVVLVAFVTLTLCCPGKTIQDLLGRLGGKIVMRVLIGLFGLFLMFRLYLSMVSCEQFLFTNLYDRGNWLTVSLPIVVVLMYGASKGLRAIARAVELIGMLIVFVLAVGIVAMLTQADFALLAPVLHEGGDPLWQATESTVLGTGEGLIYFMLLGRVERFHLVRNMSVSFGLSSFFVIGYNICYYGYYGDAAAQLKYGAAVGDMLQYMRGADTLARMDLFFELAMLILALVKLMVYAWGVTECVRIVCGLKGAHSARMWASFPVGVVLVVCDVFFQTSIFEIFNVLDAGWSFAVFVPFQAGIPLLVAVGAIIARRRAPLTLKYKRRRKVSEER